MCKPMASVFVSPCLPPTTRSVRPARRDSSRGTCAPGDTRHRARAFPSADAPSPPARACCSLADDAPADRRALPNHLGRDALDRVGFVVAGTVLLLQRLVLLLDRLGRDVEHRLLAALGRAAGVFRRRIVVNHIDITVAVIDNDLLLEASERESVMLQRETGLTRRRASPCDLLAKSADRGSTEPPCAGPACW